MVYSVVWKCQPLENLVNATGYYLVLGNSDVIGNLYKGMIMGVGLYVMPIAMMR